MKKTINIYLNIWNKKNIILINFFTFLVVITVFVQISHAKDNSSLASSHQELTESQKQLRYKIYDILKSIVEPWRANHSKGANNLNKLYGDPKFIADLDYNVIGLAFPNGPFRSREELAENLVDMVKRLADLYKKEKITVDKLGAIIYTQKEKNFEGIATYDLSNPKYIDITIYPNTKKKRTGYAEFNRLPVRVIWN